MRCFAKLVKNVEFDAPFGATIVALEGLSVPFDSEEKVALIGDYHVELDDDDYQIIP